MANPTQHDFDGDGLGDDCDGDQDGDGVADDIDACPSSPLDEAVDAIGCTGSQIVDATCSCNDEWRNHGAYVHCVAHEAEAQIEAGLVTEAEKDDIVSTRARTGCGAKR